VSSRTAANHGQRPSVPLLEGQDLGRRFGGVTALEAYDLSLRPGEVLGLIGPNGAGKTTAFNLLTGVLAPTTGRIRVGGAALEGRGPEAFAAAGIARTFQNIRLFRDLTVWENVAVGAHAGAGPGWLATVLGLPSAARRERWLRERAMALLDLVGLADRGRERAGDLPYGLQRKVEIARALATAPSVLLPDEPAAGLDGGETRSLMGLVRRLVEDGTLAVVVVEHDMRLVMALCHRLQVLDRGRLIAEGTPAEVQADAGVVEAYLGRRRREPVAC
jgi:branched-chain amino acid transport system ATP-binding protein